MDGRDPASSGTGGIACPPLTLSARPQIAHGARQLVAARRRFAEPERDRRRRALRVGDADGAAADLQDLPRGVAELEDVAGVALDREVFVERADERVVRLEHDAVVGDLGDRAAGGEREHSRSAAAAHLAVHFVAMDERAAPPALRRESVGDHLHDRVEVVRASGRDTATRGARPRTARPRRSRGTTSRRRSAARARRAARRARRCDRARRAAPRAAARRIRTGRRATPGRDGPSEGRRPCGPTGRRAGETWRCDAAIRSGRPGRRGRCRCRAPAMRSPRAL